MKRDNNMARAMARLEEAQRRTQERMELEQERINMRFDKMREQLAKKYGQPNDSQKRIIDAALQLLNEEGLNNLSLRKLARMVDMQASALYWHFKNKDVLIDYMAEAILQSEFEDFEPRRDGETWQNWLVKACQRLRKAMLSHRDGGRIVAGAHLDPAVTLTKFLEVSMQSLTSAGIELSEANLIITTAVGFVFGSVIEEQASPSVEEIKKLEPDKFFADYPLVAESVKLLIKQAHADHDKFEDALRLIVR